MVSLVRGQARDADSQSYGSVVAGFELEAKARGAQGAGADSWGPKMQGTGEETEPAPQHAFRVPRILTHASSFLTAHTTCRAAHLPTRSSLATLATQDTASEHHYLDSGTSQQHQPTAACFETPTHGRRERRIYPRGASGRSTAQCLQDREEDERSEYDISNDAKKS